MLFFIRNDRDDLSETSRQGLRLCGDQFEKLDLPELMAFFGLLLIRRTYKSSGQGVEELALPMSK